MIRSLLTLVLVAACFTSQAQWSVIPYPYFGFQRAVHFLDANTGYVGAYGRVRKTTDSGTTWSPAGLNGPDQVILNVLDIMAVHAINANTVVAGGTNNALGAEMIVRTTDGGAVWEIMHVGPGGSELNDLHFPSTTIGYAVGTNGRILKTVDGGVTWSAQNSGSGNELSGVFFKDPLRGMAVGDGIVLMTTDGGANWTSTALNGYLVGIEAFGTSSWVASGNNGECWLSEDNGASWQDRSLPLNTSTSRLTVSSGGRIHIAAQSAIYVTDNLGLLWERYPQPANVSYVNDIQATPALGGVGFAVSEGGKVLKNNSVSGPAHPIALFQPSSLVTTCVGIPITFQNLSSPAYSSVWKVDGVVVGTSTDLSTTFNQAGTVELRLVVSNGFFSDSTIATVDVVNIPGPSPAPTIMTFPASLCPGTQMTIQVNNSTPNILYQVHVNGVPYGGPMGGGSWSFQFPNMAAQLGVAYTVVSSRVTPCGTFIEGTYAVPVNIVPLADPNATVTLSPTLMCDPGVPEITISPSQIGITYRVMGQHFPGNGGPLTIALPVPNQSTTYTVVGRNALNCDVTLTTAPALTYAPMVPNFTLTTTTPFAGQAVSVVNNSAAISHAWNLGANATPSTSTAPSPSMSYSTTGPDTITVTMANAEGCDRTVRLGIHVYEPIALDGGEACRVDLMGVQGWAFTAPYHHVIGHHISGDGSTYLCGYYSNALAPTTYNYFLRKLDADGNVLWTQQVNPQDLSGYNYRSSSATAITSDGYGNIYLTGTYSSNYFRFGTLVFQHSQVNTNPFIVKMDPDGNALWAILCLTPGTDAMGGTDLLRLEDGSLWAIVKTSGSGIIQDAAGTQTYFSELHRDKLLRFNEAGQILQINGFGPLVPVGSYNAGLFNPNPTTWTGGKIVTVGPRMKAMPDGRIVVGGEISGAASLYFGSTTIALDDAATLAGGYLAMFNPGGGWEQAFKTYTTAQPIQLGTGRTNLRVFPCFAVDDAGNIAVATHWEKRPEGASTSFYRFVLGNGEVQVGDSGSVLMKWSPDGQLLWKRRNHYSIARDLEWDGARFALLAEYRGFLGLTSAQAPSVGLVASGNWDAGIAFYSSDGEALSARSLGSSGTDKGYNMVVHPCGGLQVPGTAGATVSVGGAQLHGIDTELYLMRYGTQLECAVAMCPEITLSTPLAGIGPEYKVFPNPTNGTAILQGPSSVVAPRTIEALDASGRTVVIHWQWLGDRALVGLEHLQDGVYSLRVTQATGEHRLVPIAIVR